MSKRIISQHIITVFSDGSILTKEYKPKVVNFDCPDSILQIVAVIKKAIIDITDTMEITDFSTEEDKLVPDFVTHRCVTASINEVSRDFGVTSATVHTKITRYLGMEMDEFKRLVAKYYEHLIMGKEGIPEIILVLEKIAKEKCRNEKSRTESIACIRNMHEEILDTGHRPMDIE